MPIHIHFTPKSLQILLARMSWISVCRGIVERLFCLGYATMSVVHPLEANSSHARAGA